MSRLLLRHAWILPLSFALLLGGAGYLFFRGPWTTEIEELESKLVASRDTTAYALEIWAAEKKTYVELLADQTVVREAALELLRIARTGPDPGQALLSSPAQAVLAAELRSSNPRRDHPGYAVVGLDGRFVAHDETDWIGSFDPGLPPIVAPIFQGRTILTRPVLIEVDAPLPPSDEADDDELLPNRLGRSMLAGTPIRDDAGVVVGAIGYRIDPGAEFDQLFRMARLAGSGETYVFDREGHLLTPSRFEEALYGLGLLEQGRPSVMNVQVRDPGGDLTDGFVPERSLAARPFTKSAAGAIAGESGVDTDGYRDYRGVEVVGAWTWLPSLGFGLASEVDWDEAYASVLEVRRSFVAVMGLLLLSSTALFFYAMWSRRLGREADAVRRLGRFEIESRIGKGGMGTVYLAHHSLLRRPTAIKVLNTERAGKDGIERFKREVRTSAALMHPNTIEIYDYGHTSDGTFYYAMEYVEGCTLAEISKQEGPLPEMRVLHVMRQVCGSIAEAHAAGLIHRDLKPSNVMLCVRGGLHDFAKVLDFGLVRPIEQPKDAALTDATALTGTPLFMPPEAVRSSEAFDTRSDVYQLGLVAYTLLTGTPPFAAESPMEVMIKHVHETPRPPSEVLGRTVSPSLEKLILDCLAKEPESRPRDAGVLLARFEECVVLEDWSSEDARVWWQLWNEREAAKRAERETGTSTGTLPTGIELAERTPAS